jgi:hypothetical protein
MGVGRGVDFEIVKKKKQKKKSKGGQKSRVITYPYYT